LGVLHLQACICFNIRFQNNTLEHTKYALTAALAKSEIGILIGLIDRMWDLNLFHPNITIHWILPFPSPFASRQTRFKFFTFIWAMSTTTIDLPNPYTPMAWLRPEMARKHALQLYAAVGSLAVRKLILKGSRFR